MDFLNNLIRQLKGIWDKSTVPYRIGLVASVALTLATMLGVGWWASRPQFTPLAEGLSPREAAIVQEKLDAAGVTYKKSLSASTILVPETQFADAQIAIKDLGLAGSLSLIEPSEGSSPFMRSPRENDDLLVRSLEKRLEATLQRMPAVESAKVNIAMPDRPIFARDQLEPSAGVVLGVRRGMIMTPNQAANVARVVQSSVERLPLERVTVTDLNGQLLFPNSSTANDGLSSFYEHKSNVEADAAARVKSILEAKLGPGRATVTVHAELEHKKSERRILQLDPEAVTTSETITTMEEEGSTSVAAGAAGTASNLTANLSARNAAPSSMKKEEIKTEKVYGQTEEETTDYGGRITRLTVAAVVNIPDDPNANPPAPIISVDDLKSLIEDAIGFDSERNDSITVLESDIVGVDAAVPTLLDTLNRWDFYNNLVRNASLGLAAIVALVLGILLIRKLQPLESLRGGGDLSEGTRSSLLAELSAQAKDNPEIVSKIVSAWLSTPATIPIDSAQATSNEQQRAAA